MKHNRIGNRILAMLLAAVLILSMLPAVNTSAVPIDADGYLGNVQLLDNDESISMPIRVNNFALDGMMFEYLSDDTKERNSQYFVYETGGTYQLFPFHLANKQVGVDRNGNRADEDVAPDSNAMSGVDMDHSLHGAHETDTKNYIGVTSGGTQYDATLEPYEMTDGSGTMYLQLRQYDRQSYSASARTWRKLTRFSAPKTMSKSRYAVLIYRVNGNTYYNNMLLTWESYDEVTSGEKYNCSQTVNVVKNTKKAANAKWQYAIIDLAYNLGNTEEERAAAAATKTIQDIYLKSPLNYFRDGDTKAHNYDGVTYPPTGNSMDLAAVAYFPYYGDAEQFVHYGLSLGCAQKYYGRDNSAFNFNSAADGYTTDNYSVGQWDDMYYGNQVYINHQSNTTFKFQENGSSDANTINTVEELSYVLFGESTGASTWGLLEPTLGENGLPVYKEVVVDFVAHFLRRQLTGVEEYPTDNYGWKNASFVTGVSTTSGIDEARFGKDAQGHSIDLATALCNCVEGAVKGRGGTYSGTMGTYAETRAKARELTGSWKKCKDNIDTWFDAAYYLLHNLYATKEDVKNDGDGYGEYENLYHNLILPQANLRNYGDITSAYCFDAGFAKNGNARDGAVVYDRDNGLIRMDFSADLTGGLSPFLPTGGNGTEAGESNSPYYIDPTAIKKNGGYQARDYHFTISGNGFFQYEQDLFFEFKGDDDVYLFINGQLVLDIGGTHAATLSKIHLDDYVDWAWAIKNGTAQYKGKNYADLSSDDRARVDGLALLEGGVYSFDFFYMERHGAGSNLRIVTNIQVTAEGLNVDKTAYQNDIEVAENGIVDVRIPVEYGFKITNDTSKPLFSTTFEDSVIGVSMDYINGLQISPETASYVRNASGNPLTVADLEIVISGSGSTVVVTCQNNEELKAFLQDMTSNDGTQSGGGLWSGASIEIRGIYYHLTDSQKAVSSFRNYVSATADAGDVILRGADDHTVYQPGKPAYYQWVGKPVIIEREKLYRDLLDGVVANANDLPALADMILIPSDAYGIERQDNGLVNTRGGDVYLKINFDTPRSYISYVTIRDRRNPSYRMTVPITVYVTDAKDSAMVLDYGLDSYLTDQEAIFDYELDLAVGENVTGTVMGIANKDIKPSYHEYDTSKIDSAEGNTKNNLTLIDGSYADKRFTNARLKLDTPIYLEHTKPWVVEFNVGHMQHNDCLLATAVTKMSEDHKERLYLTNTGIGLGYSDGTNERFYGVAYDKFRSPQMTTVKLFNVPAADGSNMVYCSIGGGAATAMNNVYVNRVSQNKTDSSWISGRDFTFSYLGCNGHGLHLNMDYLRVYEEGGQLTHYRWEKNGNEYECTDTGKTGYEAQPIVHTTFTNGGDTVHRWSGLDLTLNSDRAWEIEFELKNVSLSSNFMLFSSTNAKTTNVTEYVYIIPSKRFICMGSDVDGSYVNYGVILPDSFDITQPHTYLLKNRIRADGSNMVYLYVDRDENGEWTEVGPLNYYSLGSSIGTQSDGLSGHDFNFKYVGGHDRFGIINEVITYMEVHEDTALRTAYAWKWTEDTTVFASVNATSDGNRINFEKEADGVVEVNDTKFTLESDRLKFETSTFMDRAYTTYVALSIHDKDHVPTPLNQTNVDVAKEVQMYKKVSVIPANVVYYEDDFPAIHYIEGNENVFTPIGTSTLDQLQSPDQHTPYGSDEAYQNDFSNMSADHVQKIQIKEDDRCLAWFAFRGTGFELISSTNAVDTAMVYVQVYNRTDVTIADGIVTPKEGEKALAFLPLLPEFDQGNNDGADVIHQVPLLRWQRQDDVATTDVDESVSYGAYVVTISAYATYDFSQYDPQNPDAQFPMLDTYLYIDGIRIFQPMGYDNSDYAQLENKVLFDEVRDQILNSKMMACEQTEAGVIMSSGTVTWTERFTGLDYTGTYFEGNKVNNVNDYLLMGPNNEVYMDGTLTESSLAFVVYRNPDDLYKNRDLGLQIGVRAIDVGNFYGVASTGMKANLEIGVTDASGNCGWMHLATVSSGTEQYITVPYTLCPMTAQNGIWEYHVVIRVSSYSEDIPAMVSFSSLKRTEGLELKTGIGEALTIFQDEFGQWVTSTGVEKGITDFLTFRRTVMSESLVSYTEAVRGENFVNNTVVPEVAPAIMPQYPALSFEEEVQYHVFYTVQNLDGVSPEDMGLITFGTENQTGTLSDAMDVIPGAVKNDSQYIVHTNGISAKKLGDTLYFKVYAKLADGSYVYSDLYNYSAKTYAMNQLKGTNDAVKPLVVAMLNYGSAAQQYFDYRTDSLMNADLTADQQALVQKYDSGMASAIVPVESHKAGAFVANGGFTRMRPSVTFGGAFSINYFFTPAYAPDGEITMYYWDAKTLNSIDAMTAENALGIEKMVQVEGGEYFAAYTDIAAKEIGDTVYVAAVYESNGVTYCTGVLPYSLSLYCKRFAENTTSPAQNLAAATMVYGHYAEKFFG